MGDDSPLEKRICTYVPVGNYDESVFELGKKTIQSDIRRRSRFENQQLARELRPWEAPAKYLYVAEYGKI